MKNYRGMVVFVGIALAVHLVLIFGSIPSCARDGAKPPDGGASPSLEVQKAVESGPVRINMVQDQTENEEPIRVSSNTDKGEEAAITGEATEDEDVKPVEEEPEEEKEEPVEEAEPENKIINSAADLEKAKDDLSKKTKTVVQCQMSSAEYRLYVKKQNTGKMKGAATPPLVHAFSDLAEMMEVHKHYHMKIFAIDESSPYNVVEVVGFGTPQVSFQRIPELNWSGFSNRIFERTSPYFAGLKRRMKEEGFITEKMTLHTVVPSQIDYYFRHKQLENIKRSGVDEKDVKTVLSRFRKTSFGWIMEVSQLHLKSGKLLDVQDFELSDLGK